MEYKILNEDSENFSLIQILKNRGIEDPAHYLNVSDEDIINPATIRNMKEAAQCLVQAIHNNETCFVNVDSDCDGYTSAAVLINYLHRRFPTWVDNKVHFGMHEGKTHGLLTDLISACEATLVLCPDAGSEEYDIHAQLAKEGRKVIIIDHHNASHYSEDAIVINNQLDENYPTKSLSGVAMVWKFCSYLDSFFNDNIADYYLDLVALGVLADAMDLRQYETHRIVEKGCAHIWTPFMVKMVEKNSYNMKDKVTPKGVSWYIAPAVNAVTRVGTQEEKTLLFKSMLDYMAYTEIPSTKRGHKGEMETIIEQSIRTCANVRNRQNKERDSLFESLQQQIEDNNLLENKILLVQIDNPDEKDREITGLIANKIMSTYGHPVMLLNKTIDRETGEVFWGGSGRNTPSNALPSLQQLAKDSGYFELAQGHDNAFGVIISEPNISKFIEYSNEILKDAKFSAQYNVDLVITGENLPYHEDDILSIAESDDLWGQGVEEPLILLKDIIIAKNNLSLLGKNKNTLKFTFSSSSLTAIKFQASESEYEDLNPGDGYVKVDIIGRCSKNTGWDNAPQILIEDYSIEEKQEYYF